MTEPALKLEETIIRLDLGCGKNKRPDFIGVDAIAFEGVDVHHDLTKAWPWPDESVTEAYSSHFVEHLEWPERVHFFNELHRVLKKGATAQIITPHWAHACFYGDPTHKAPMSEWYANYLNKAWRDVNAPHTGYTCDFDFVVAGGFDEWLASRSMETRMFAMARYVNSTRDLIVNLTKK